jgi:uncharacterized protein affecting Mg2+/Co2+ transport
MKEPNDPKRDGFMRVDEIVALIQGEYRLVDNDGEAFVVHTAGKVRDDTINRLMMEGWIERGNRHWKLTDEGRKAYLRSTDELGNGKLIPPRNVDANGFPLAGTAKP